VNQQQRRSSVERYITRSRWLAVPLLGLGYVFLPGDGDDALHVTVLVAGGVFLWLPGIIDTVRGFRVGWRGDDAEGTH
jgi:hypothetical protein